MGESRTVRTGDGNIVWWSKLALRAPGGHLKPWFICTQLSY